MGAIEALIVGKHTLDHSRVSIPVGAIEAVAVYPVPVFRVVFQFQWVRLRPCATGGRARGTWVSIPVGAIEAHPILVGAVLIDAFQFQWVRLRPVHWPQLSIHTYCFNSSGCD